MMYAKTVVVSTANFRCSIFLIAVTAQESFDICGKLMYTNIYNI